MSTIWRAVLGVAVALPLAARAETLVLRGAEIHTAAGPVIPEGTLVVRDGVIAAVGAAGAVAIPDGAELRDVSGRVIVPGLVDTHTHIGIYPRPRVEANSDGNERSGPQQSGLRAIDAVWPGDPAIRMALAGGITTANIMPGSGNVIGGQTAYVKLRGDTIEDMLLDAGGISGGMKMANGENPKRSSPGKAPTTRMAVAALQREVFVRAADYKRKWDEHRAERGEPAKRPERDLALEPMVEVLEGRRTVHHHTHRADDVMTVLRLQEEFGFDLVLHHVSEGYKVADEIAARNVPASIIMLDSPGGKHEAAEFTNQSGAILERAGVRVAIHTDDYITSSRLFLRAGGLAVQAGMSEAGALAALTLNGARMLRLDDRVGSLEPGKDADFVVLSGPPFSVYTKVLETWIDGARVFDRSDPVDRRYATGGFPLGDRYPEPESGLVRGARVAPTVALALVALAAPPAAAEQLVVLADELHTGSGPPVRDAVIVVDDGRIVEVADAADFEPPAGVPSHAARWVTPGLIDVHTSAGLAGLFNVPADRDQDEPTGPNQAWLRALDAFNPNEPLLRYLLEQGVTIVQSGPGPANPIGGQAGIFRTFGSVADIMAIRSPSALVLSLGEAPKRTYGRERKAPTTRMATAAVIRNALVEARGYARKRAEAGATRDGDDGRPPDRDLRRDALASALARDLPVIFVAQRSDDLMTALRIAGEFDLRAALAGASEAYLVADEIRAAGVPVFVGPVMTRVGALETMNASYQNAAILAERGVQIAIRSGFESYVPRARVVRFEAAIAAANELGRDRALRAITLDAARFLGIDADYGTIEPGKVADLVLYDGDPLEYTTHVERVIAGGVVVYDRSS